MIIYQKSLKPGLKTGFLSLKNRLNLGVSVLNSQILLRSQSLEDLGCTTKYLSFFCQLDYHNIESILHF